MIITVLGSCANQTALREGVALLIEDDAQVNRLLIDAGPGIVASLQRCSRCAFDIDHIFLTHTHGDHISGIAYLIWHRFYEGLGRNCAAKDLTIYGLDNALSLAKQMLEGCYGPTSFPFKINFKTIEPNAALKIEGFSVHTCLAAHTTPTLSCSIQNATKKIAYSSDSLPTDEFILLAESADLLLHEGMWTEANRQLADKTKHATASDAAKVAFKSKSKQLVLLHIFPSYLGREAELIREASQYYNGPLSIPYDGTLYQV